MREVADEAGQSLATSCGIRASVLPQALPWPPKDLDQEGRKEPWESSPPPLNVASRNYIPFLRVCRAEWLVAFSDADIKFLAEALIKLHNQARY